MKYFSKHKAFSFKPKTIGLKLLLLFLICTANFQLASAQRFPVQVNQSLIPPYNTKLNSYATSTDVKLRLFLTLTDVNVSNRQVRLKLKIQGKGLNIQSADFVTGASPIFLNGGTQQQFTNLDLAPYFRLNNLLGINPQQYNQPLPDGSYKICWEVYDALTNQLISNTNTGCSNIFLLLNDPPFLNLPNRGDQLTDIQPTNIVFQWTPRHANATNVSYEFEIRELWDKQIDPQAAFLASPPFHTETSFSTTLLYNIGKPTLIPGRTYGWRVRAKSTTGLSENSVFKNNGYSEIFYFTFTNQCFPPTFTLAEPIDKRRVKINWQTHPDHNRYHVQYKRADVADAEWFEAFSYNNQVEIANLQDGVTYNFRVGGTCHALTDFEQAFSYSAVNQFTMPTADESLSYSCGIVPEITITNTNPLDNIGVNETFTAGDFPVTIKQIEGGNGNYSGTGFIVVPYLADTKIAVEFNNININTDYQLYDGIIRTTYDPTWSGGVESVDGFVEELEYGIRELKNIIVEALNLDITSDTKEKINLITKAIISNINDENIPQHIKNNITKAVHELKEASDAYSIAKQTYENPGATDDEKKIAREKMTQANKEFNNAQENLEAANKELEKYKNTVSDLLKKAIIQIYRNGKDVSEEQLDKANEIVKKQDNNINNNYFIFDFEKIEEVEAIKVNKDQRALNNLELKLGVYLFSKVLSEVDNESDTFILFLEKIEQQNSNLLTVLKEKIEAQENDAAIINYLAEELIIVFSNILITNTP